MLVRMDCSKSIQISYTAREPMGCGVCKTRIPTGGRYTRHQAPDPHHVNPVTHRYAMVPYIACFDCAPYTNMEEHTGAISLDDISLAETQLQLNIVRTPTQPLTKHTTMPHTTRLVREGEEAWIR